jgi:hypothetical protein
MSMLAGYFTVNGILKASVTLVGMNPDELMRRQQHRSLGRSDLAGVRPEEDRSNQRATDANASRLKEAKDAIDEAIRRNPF